MWPKLHVRKEFRRKGGLGEDGWSVEYGLFKEVRLNWTLKGGCTREGGAFHAGRCEERHKGGKEATEATGFFCTKGHSALFRRAHSPSLWSPGSGVDVRMTQTRPLPPRDVHLARRIKQVHDDLSQSETFLSIRDLEKTVSSEGVCLGP